MISKIKFLICSFVVIVYVGAIYAQEPIQYVVYSSSNNVVKFLNGNKTAVKKGQIIDDNTIVDIPAGESIRLIDRMNKLVFEISGKAKNRLSVLAKNVKKTESLTGKFLTFLKNGVLAKASDSSMHEQKAGTIFRDDDILLEEDSVETDSTSMIATEGLNDNTK